MTRRISLGRVVAVTGALVGVGAVVGAAIGAAIMLGMILGWSIGSPGTFFVQRLSEALLVGAAVGGAIGALAAPLLAWIFLRRVSLGRAIGETAIGTLIGGLLGIAVPPLIIPAALIGFVVAGVSLYVRTRRKASPVEPPLIGV